MPELTPFHQVEQAAGAIFGTWAGWSLPGRFGDAAEEYGLARDAAVLFDVSHRAKLELRGADRVSFLQGFCTNDVAKLPEGGGCEAFVTTAQARILAWLHIFKLSDRLWLEADAGLATKIIEHLTHYAITEDVESLDRTRDLAELHVTGPRANAALSQVFGADFANLSPLQIQELNFGAVRCQLYRHDPLGQAGFDLLCPAETASELWQALVEQGVFPAGLEAYDMLRVEAGTPEYDRDIDESNLPQEVGRDAQAISFTKGCYLGQEPVVRIRDLGHVNRRLVGLKLAGAEPVPAGSKVLSQGQEIGKVTSSVFSPRLGSAIALAYVRQGHQDPGTGCEIAAGPNLIAAEVAILPFG